MKLALIPEVPKDLTKQNNHNQVNGPKLEAQNEQKRTVLLAYIKLANGSEVFLNGATNCKGEREYSLNVIACDGTTEGTEYSSAERIIGAIAYLAETNDHYFSMLNHQIFIGINNYEKGKKVKPMIYDLNRWPALDHVKNLTRSMIDRYTKRLEFDRKRVDAASLSGYITWREYRLCILESELNSLEAMLLEHDPKNAGNDNHSQESYLTISVLK